jgi:hypothetical protein
MSFLKLNRRLPNKLFSFMNDTNCVQIIFLKMFDSARTIGLGCKYLHVLTTFSLALIQEWIFMFIIASIAFVMNGGLILSKKGEIPPMRVDFFICKVQVILSKSSSVSSGT